MRRFSRVLRAEIIDCDFFMIEAEPCISELLPSGCGAVGGDSAAASDARFLNRSANPLKTFVIEHGAAPCGQREVSVVRVKGPHCRGGAYRPGQVLRGGRADRFSAPSPPRSSLL